MMRRNCWTAALCLALMLFGGHRLRADEPERQWAELKAKMETQGWTEIADGVFERRLGANKVERLGYGREGVLWHVDHYMQRLERLMQEYESSPSEELADLIDKLSVTLSNVKQGVRDMPEELSSATAAAQYGDSCSSICYSATANAYPLTAVQGVAAVAEAKFNSACGFSGETYAEARAIATKDTTTTEVHQQDPRSGTSLTSQAVASVEGGTALGVPCESSANSWVASTALTMAYSTEDYNNLCPAPVNTSITSGPTSVPFTTATCATQTWDATATDGVSPYTYKWYVNNSEVGTGSSYSQSVCHDTADFALKVVCTDANGGTDNESRTIDVIPPVSVSMSPPSSISFTTATCATTTWTASAVDGTPPYTYKWYVNNTEVGTGSSYSRPVCHNHADFTLKVVATDANGTTDNKSRTIDVIPPPPPLSVSMSGPSSVSFTTATCSTKSWTASASGGTSPYSYKWYVNNTQVGTGATYSRSVCYNHADFTLKVTATDSSSPVQTASDTRNINVDPPPAPSVTINGSTDETFLGTGCRNVTWTSTVSGGSSPYTYQWKYNGTNIATATASSYTRSVCHTHSSFTLSLTVTDSTSGTGSDTHSVTVTYDPQPMCGNVPC